jgi:hypothetical protein
VEDGDALARHEGQRLGGVEVLLQHERGARGTAPTAEPKPKLANSGIGREHRSPRRRHRLGREARVSITPRWLRRTPLGLPMVPDV